MVSSLFSLLECSSPGTASATAPKHIDFLATDSSRPSPRDISFSNFGVKILDRVVWFWLLEQWQAFPNELWAWKFMTVWTAGHDYCGCSIWVPSLLLFDFWEYDRSSYAWVAASIIDHPRVPGPSATVVIASRLFAILRRSGESELCRTCRLVCRDWANACPIREPERCSLSFKDGSAWYRIEEEWRYLPSKYWAWTPQYEEWWVECRQGLWFPKLVRPVDDTVQQSPRYSPVLSLPPSSDSTSTRSRSLTTAALPPELIRYVCEAADNESSSSRLVCRYWNRLCTPRVFERVDVKGSPEQIRALWRHRTDPVMRDVKVVEQVPQYDERSKFPWVHLLTQACASTRSVWERRGDQGAIRVIGPFAGGHRTIRSVHFALPRSLPRSLSRGIKRLYINGITFSKIEDLAQLVCELPDLETLCCGVFTEINPDSLPIQLPRRRPRTNCNKLREVGFNILDQDDLLETALTVYLSVYDAMSFFSDGEITIIRALLKPLRRLIDQEFCYKYDPHDHSRRLCSQNDLWNLCILRDLRQNHIILTFVLDCWSTESEDLDRWTQLDTEFDKIKGLIWQANFVFGFRYREKMIKFATYILEKTMPSISKFTTVLYSIQVKNEANFDDGWYQASLDSEELTGTPKEYPWDVYS